MTCMPFAAAAASILSVLGPGTVSARSNRAALRWSKQKYVVVASSWKAIIFAPEAAASAICFSIEARF